MRIIQILENVIDGDGVSNCALYLKELFDNSNLENYVYTFNYMSKEKYENTFCISSLHEILLEKDDIVYYHFCTGSMLNYEVEHLKCKKVLVFQNVTPPVFFRGINTQAAATCALGENDSLYTAGNYLKCITPSYFSKNQLVEAGWNADDILVVPIIKRELPTVKPDTKLVEQLAAEGTKFLFVGRVVGNKKYEDIIDIFVHYKKYYDSNAKLYFVGSTGEQVYYEALKKYICRLRCSDIVFTGKVSEEELAAYYSNADVFICMSEHEGLCLPVLEAMKYDTPVVAYSAAAIPDTMGDAGILVDTKDPGIICKSIAKLLRDDHYRESMIQKQREHVDEYCLDGYVEQVLALNSQVDSIEQYKYKFEDERLELKKEYPSYVIGTTLKSNENNEMMPFVLKGIHEYDGYSNWTDGTLAILALHIEQDNKRTLRLKIALKDTFNGVQSLSIKANGVQIYCGEHCGNGELLAAIPTELIQSERLIISMELPNAISPFSLDPNNDDKRELALAIESIELIED